MSENVLYVADSDAVIAIAGIRTVTKADVQYTASSRQNEYRIIVTYKGLERMIIYSDAQARDATYNAIVEAMPKCKRV